MTGGWIERLLRHVRQDPSIGLLCPVTNFAGNEIKINVSYTGWQERESFARSVAASKSGQRMEIGVAPLYCALMPRAVRERVGSYRRLDPNMLRSFSARRRQNGSWIKTLCSAMVQSR